MYRKSFGKSSILTKFGFKFQVSLLKPNFWQFLKIYVASLMKENIKVSFMGGKPFLRDKNLSVNTLMQFYDSRPAVL